MIDNQFKKNRKTFHLGISCCLITSFYMLTVRCSFYSLLVFCCSHLRSTFFFIKSNTRLPYVWTCPFSFRCKHMWG